MTSLARNRTKKRKGKGKEQKKTKEKREENNEKVEKKESKLSKINNKNLFFKKREKFQNFCPSEEELRELRQEAQSLRGEVRQSAKAALGAGVGLVGRLVGWIFSLEKWMK